MTLAEAIGSDGVWRFKDKSKAPKPSWYLGSMILRGIGQKSISVVKSPLNQFVEYAGGSSECKAALKADKISGFLLAKACKWIREVRKQNRARMNTFCGWLVRQVVLASNPVEKIDKIESDGFDSYVLTPDECKENLKVCAAKHPIMSPLLVLNLFCRIRPSECQRLSPAKGRNSNFRWEGQEILMQAKKTKPRCGEQLK